MVVSTNVEEISAINQSRLRDASEILLQARRTVTPVVALPEALRPTSLAEAYFLQDVMIAELGDIGGWKVGAASPDAVPVFGPMFDFGISASGSLIATAMRRMRGIEAEIAFLIGEDLPPREAGYSRDEVVSAITSAHPAIELLESAYVDPDKVDRLSMIGDLQQHGGFVYGDAYPDWRGFDYAQEQVTVAVDGVLRVAKGVNAAGPDLLQLVVWLANQPRTRGLRKGQWITTGSWTGKTLAQAGSSAHVHFTHFGEVRLQFE